MTPELRTKRLKLRAVCADDIPAFVPLLNDFDVVRNLAPIPHPYSVADGRAFIARTERSRAAGLVLNYAVERADGTFIGFCTANIEDEGRRPGEGKRELGYWYGRKYWAKVMRRKRHLQSSSMRSTSLEPRSSLQAGLSTIPHRDACLRSSVLCTLDWSSETAWRVAVR